MIEKKLKDVFEFARNGVSIKQYENKGGYPITRIETIWNRKIDENKFGYADVTDEELDNYEKYLLQTGDILMTHINSPKHLGKCAMYKGQPDKLIHGMNLLCLRPNKSVAIPSFLEYYFNSKFFTNQLPKISNQSVNQASFSAGNLQKLKIPLPPLETQKKIAAILDEADKLRQLDKQLIEKYDELTQSLFLDMFGDPVTNSKGWELVDFKDVLVLKRGFDLPVQDRTRGDFPIMASNGILDWHNEFKVKGPGVVTGRSGTLGKVHFIENNYWPLNTALYSQDLKRNNPLYILLLLRNFRVERFSRGAGVPTLNRNLVHSEKIISVPIELQNQFAERVQAIEAQKALAQQSLEKSEELFNSLLQKAFKGELV